MKKFVGIDDETAELLTKMANELFHHDYPLRENHFHTSDIKYIYKAAEIYRRLLKVKNAVQ